MANVKFDTQQLNIQVQKIVERVTLPKARVIAANYLHQETEELIEQILEQGVIRELVENDHSQSAFIKSEAGDDEPDTLFGFLGFIQGSKPVDELTDYIRSNTRVNLRARLINGYYRFPVFVPTMEEIKNNTSMEWTKKSWVSALENGLSSIHYYVFSSKSKSRSKEGLQIKNYIPSKELKTSKFLTPLVRDFIKRVRKVKL